MRVVAVIALLVLAGCTAPHTPPEDLEPGTFQGSGHPLEGTPAPAYTADALGDDERSLQEMGNVTLLFVWASWCTVCKADEPHLEEVHAAYAEQGFEIMAVSHEVSRDDAAAYAASEDWAFPAYWDPDVNEHFGLRGYQPNYLLIEDGTIRWVQERGIRGGAGFDVLRHNIEALLGA